MAALNRPTEATYVIHDNVTVDTNDHEDHTFCGIMFPVKCKDLLPLNHVVIHNLAVRGRLGPLTVWVSNLDEENNAIGSDDANHDRSFRMNKKHWTKLYERTHQPSFRQYQDLDLRQNPIVLKPGQVRAVYIHSTLHGDEAIVYDNRHGRRTYDDSLISILPGRAHVSPKAFSAMPIWGWGNAWRDHREFVGRIEFGAVYKLWNPMTAHRFGSQFQSLVRTLFLCQRNWDSPLSMLPDDCIFYILNMCRWDWAGDADQHMKDLKRRRKKKEDEYAAVAAAEARAAAYVAANNAQAKALVNRSATESTAAAGTEAVSSTTAGACCAGSSCRERSDDHDDDASDEVEEQFHSADEDEDEDDDAGIQSDTAGTVNGQDGEYLPDEVDAEEDEWDSDAEEEEEEDGNESDDWDSDDAYHASNDVFTYRDDDSDEEGQINNEAVQERNRRAWIRRQFARIHVLQALADGDGNHVMELDF
mmetsp:Transcript_19877/g.30702  ORF Transcript_19877/g.30702 Transcript_19877/m.30702 type:complete len:474 (-) Transcript_19877:171-1592(-)|eukprot:CAMPEP_0195293836 /NCGR_PEP_ID=MMETSP0707-20130614/13501_1 /TAXON_ID=33640 /ORGANISM="Asterionellopsis glacialis, Strain CCMP134" /LENGTH=473 /DNA_ID=CAMNT_0040354641 /DNA_START=259 /DNA_END=1680 /DNA_ORIENTATION=+